MRTNTVAKDRSHLHEPGVRLAGGFGAKAARQDAEARLRRLVLANLLWEDIAYCDGQTVTQQIRDAIPHVAPGEVARIAVEARFEQKLRHVPLLMCREMARLPDHKAFVADTLAKVIKRPDELAEFVSMYWEDNGGKKTLSAQVKRGLARAFTKFDEYQLAKWDKQDRKVKLKDVLFLCHAKPGDTQQMIGMETERKRDKALVLRHPSCLFDKLANGTLRTPDTWEVALSAAGGDDAKKSEEWVRLIESGKLPAFALLKNLRNMVEHGVPKAAVRKAFETCNPAWLLPIDFLKAVEAAPDYIVEIENLMYRCAAQWPKLKGDTILVVDVSGSMNDPLTSKRPPRPGKPVFSRMHVAASMAVLAHEMCEHITIYVTAGNDRTCDHKTEKVSAYRGFALSKYIVEMQKVMGGGGIFTRQCVEHLRKHEKEDPDRIIVFSDSQDCDHRNRALPKPFGKFNYIVDVSSHAYGVNYKGVWTAEIAGWSEHFLKYIAAMEGAAVGEDRDEEPLN